MGRLSAPPADRLASTVANVPGFVIIGNPENRRVGLFQDALARQRQQAARVIPWRELAAEEGAAEAVLARDLKEEPALVRIDSFGEDFDVERELLVRGFEDARALGAWAVPPDEIRAMAYDRGRIFAPRQQHCGFLRVLREVENALAARPWLRVLNAPRSIERLFDKRMCAVTFTEAGVPIPRPLGNVLGADDLRQRMAETGTTRVFVKLSCGSSASCLALYDWDPTHPGDTWLFTSMEIDGANLYNSLRPRRYRDSAAIDRLLGFLFREGSHVEAHVSKARSGGKFFDTRMLVVAGEVAFTVMRKSHHPITNLHLGGTRGTLAELEAVVPPSVLAAAHESCRKVHAAHDCLHVGVDVMFTAELDGHRVLEANAFGDLLPNLERNGLDVFEWQIQKALG
ncbi:MAG: hypothetical protein K0S65_2909 [Labilithrix sp.]|nr:hypothetical protein [Labilithrix sp.]